MEHAGSRDYLDGYAVVMDPALNQPGRPPQTLRVGTPPASMVEKILEPVLRERVRPLLGPKCAVWRPEAVAAAQQAAAAAADSPGGAAAAVFLSLDFDEEEGGEQAGSPGQDGDDAAAAADAAAVVARLPAALAEACSTLVAFPHPLRRGGRTTRVLAVLPAGLPPPEALRAVAALRPARGEVHLNHHGCFGGVSTSSSSSSPEEEEARRQQRATAAEEAARAQLAAAGLGGVVAVAAGAGDTTAAPAGYVLHARAAELRAASPPLTAAA